MALPQGIRRTVIAEKRETLPAAAPRVVKDGTPVVESRDLFAGRTEILIAHDGALYRMKITRQNKLILNK